MFKKLLQLKKEGTLAAFVAAGLMPVKVHMYLEIYMYINAKMTVNKDLTKTQAVLDCADIMEISKETVWRAMRIMSTQLKEETATVK